MADDADLNYWLPGTVTYLTRQDWNTFPINYNKLNLKIADSPKKDQWIAEMRGETYTISDTGAAAEAVPGPKFTASEIGAEQLNNINDPYWDKLVHAITIDEAVGAVIHGGSRSDTLTNIDNPVVIQNEGPTGISAGYTDEATGKTYKFNVNSQTLLGCSFNPELAYQWGLVEGNSCLWVERYDLWGSGLTLNRTPYNGRNYEYISEDPMLTNVIGREVIQGCSDKGIINGPKHMGFNDQEHNRAGISAYMTEQKFRETDLRGFEGALSDAFGMGVMIAFNRIGATNASHHVGMIQKIVRGEWGFKGLISTDMMNNYLYFNAESMVMAFFQRRIVCHRLFDADAVKLNLDNAVPRNRRSLQHLAAAKHAVLYNVPRRVAGGSRLLLRGSGRRTGQRGCARARGCRVARAAAASGSLRIIMRFLT